MPSVFRFAVQLLGEEIEALAGTAAWRQHAPDLGHVSGQPRQLLGHVDPGREHGEFLLQSILVRVEPGFLQPLRELLVEQGVDQRDARHTRATWSSMPSQLASRMACTLAPRRRDAARSVTPGRPVATTFAASSSGAIDGSASTPGQRRISLTVNG